ncbi:DUF975 family protein [Hominifimenecus sp. rT4P-3]|uniref:DUF975 family protein n=1 Tax=Hominifimenecus sp. rT4P-3 TaxID=3242979 RepID=UPI003DA45F3C
MLAICFILAFVVGEYSDTLMLFESYDSTEAAPNSVETTRLPTGKSNSEIVNELLNQGAPPDVSNSKYTNGVFADIFNNVTQSGSFLFGILNVFNQAFFHDQVGASVVLGIGMLILAFYWFWVKNVLKVAGCRFFLELSIYEGTPLSRLTFPIRVRKIWNIAKIMFFTYLYQWLWTLTIVGGIIKAYSYRMVPYILAENPAVSRKEAITLSRHMMKGNKWRAFLLDISFFPWRILNLATGGLLNLFFLNPYRTLANTNLYLELRQSALERAIPYSECLNDRYLAKQPPFAEGQTAPLQEYPVHLYPIPEVERRQWIQVDWRRSYSLGNLILLFFSFSLIGWLWEVSLHLSTDGFVNRGVLHGPWLPIYGSGGILILVLLQKVRERPWLTFGLTIVICGIVEYFTAWYLEVTKGTKWWDYSGYLLNLNGRICAEGLLVFGVGGMAIIYLGAPLLDELYRKIPKGKKWFLCTVLVTVFAIDAAYSSVHPNTGKGITDYGARPAFHQQVCYGDAAEKNFLGIREAHPKTRRRDLQGIWASKE